MAYILVGSIWECDGKRCSCGNRQQRNIINRTSNGMKGNGGVGYKIDWQLLNSSNNPDVVGVFLYHFSGCCTKVRRHHRRRCLFARDEKQKPGRSSIVKHSGNANLQATRFVLCLCYAVSTGF